MRVIVRTRLVRRLVVILLLMSNAGCGIALQTAFGWTERDKRSRLESKDVRIETVPAGTEVCRYGLDGRCRSAGTGPLVDTVDVRVEEVVERPKSAWLWVGAGIEVAAAFGVAAATASTCDDDGMNCAAAPVLTAIAMIFGATIDVMTAVLYPGFYGEEIAARHYPDEARVTYRAEKEGYQRAEGELSIDASDVLVLRLAPEQEDVEGTLVDAEKDRMIVAVMPPTTSHELRWTEAVMKQLRLDLSGAGLKTVEHSAQARAIRETTCTGARCDVEVGRMLAASHVLSSRVTKLGERCVLAAELVDLKREVTVSAVGARASCDDPDVANKLTAQLAQDLLVGFRTGTSAP